MKRVTLKKLYDDARPIQAIKALREASRKPGIHASPALMGLKEAKEAVDKLRFDKTPVTVSLVNPDALNGYIEWVIVPDADRFRSVYEDSTFMAIDNYPPGHEGQGESLFVACASGDVPMTPGGYLDTREDYQSASLSRADVERLRDFLTFWLAS